MVKKYTFYVPIYSRRVYVYIGDDYKDINKKVNKDYKIEESGDKANYLEASVVEMTHKGEGLVDNLFLLPSNVEQHTVAHECVHMAWDILDLVGVRVEADNNEALAYLVGYLMKEVNIIITKHNGQTTVKNNG